MSTSVAERAVFHHLIDDAAMFPPESASLDKALTKHLARREGRWRRLLGPLLLPPTLVEPLLAHEALTGLERPVRVSLVGRPDEPLDELRGGAARIVSDPRVKLTGLELAWAPGWARLKDLKVRLSIEVPRGRKSQKEAVIDIATTVRGNDWGQAKFRTTATEKREWPDERALANFIRVCIDHDLGFKLTGGLHHAIRTSNGKAGPQHGVLNVLSAVRYGLNGEDVDELVPRLARTDATALVEDLVGMSAADAAIVRAFFTSFGCCDAMDPIRELEALGVLEPRAT